MEDFVAGVCSPEKVEELLEEGYVYIGEIQATQLRKRRVHYFTHHRPTRGNDYVTVHLAKKEHVEFLKQVNNSKV